MRKSKVSVIQSVDVLDNAPRGFHGFNTVSPLNTSSIRPLFNEDQFNTETGNTSGVSEELVKDDSKPHALTTKSNLDLNLDKIDLVNRDPRGVNAHITIQFEEVIGEITHVRSITNCWNCFKCCYTCWKDLLYKVLSLFCAFPNAVIFGCWFGLNTFVHIWILTPFSHACNMCCGHCISQMTKLWFSCAVGIPCRACGQVFWAWNKKIKTSARNLREKRARVTFSDQVRTKRIPRVRKDDNLSESQKRVLFSRSPWQRKLF